VIPEYPHEGNLTSLLRLIFWLKKSSLGSSFLVALCSSFGYLFLHVNYPNRFLIDGMVESFFGPANRLGFYLGSILFPDYMIPHTTGFYWVPLFGAISCFVLWWMLLFAGVRFFDQIRVSKQGRTSPPA
jgi:hypothetical protein